MPKYLRCSAASKWMNHFLMRGLAKCRGEFSLMLLGYNFTRLLNILGTDALRDYCARRPGNT